MMQPSILIAGIGNIFHGDDAFGVEVVRRLAGRPLPREVQVMDFGIRGFDLAAALVNGYDAVILVDAIHGGGPPGTLQVLEIPREPPFRREPPGSAPSCTAYFAAMGHDINLEMALNLAREMGGPLPWLALVGCEPATLESEVGRLSEPVQGALDEAIKLVETLIARLLASAPSKLGG